MSSKPSYDVFLCHNSRDKERLRELNERLRHEFGLRTFFDESELVGGRAWAEHIKEALALSRSCAICLGPNGWGQYQLDDEARPAIERQLRDSEFHVIPVLLPGMNPEHMMVLEDFFRKTHWVDFRQDWHEPASLRKLASAIRGVPAFPEGKPELSPLRIRFDAFRWQTGTHSDRTLLYRGSDLREAQVILKRNPGEFPEEARDFVEASASSELKRQWVFRAAIVAVMLTITILLLITEQRRRGEQAAKRDALVALKAQKVALSATYFNEALRALEDQQGDFVLAYLARSLQKDPENFSARGLLFNLLGTGLLKAGPAVQFDEEVFSVSFSPDGRRLLVVLGSSGARVAEAQVREATTGKLVGRPIRHGFGVKEATFSPDGKKILTIGYSESTYQHRTARVWDAATGEPIGEPMPSVQGSNVTFASFSPDSQRILTASSKLGEDDGTQVWNAVTGEAISQPMRHEGSFLEIKQARFSPDGRQVVTVTSRGLFQVWDAHTGARIGEPSDFSPNEICCVAFTEKGPRVMTVFRNSATMWDVTTHKELGTVVGDTILARADFSSDGQSVIATAENHTVSVWTDFQTTPPLRHADPINSAVLSPNNRWVLTASDDKTARLWDAQTGLPIGQPMRHEDSVNDAVFSPDGRIVATASSDRTVQLWTAVTGSATPTREDVKSADFSPNGLHIVTEWGGNDGTARVWDAATAKPIGQPMHLPQFFETVSFSPDGLRILTTSGDGTARLWEAATGKPIGQPMRHRGFLRSAAFSPDGLRLVTTADDKRDLTNKGCAVYLWDTAMQKQVGLPIRSESTCAYWASFSPDGRRIVISGIGAELRDAATGDLVGKRFNYDEENVASCDLSSCAGHGAVFSSDGSRILGPGSDHTVVVWDAASGTPLGKPIRLVNRVVSWSFSPDGKHIVTASEDHVARVWDSITDEPIGQPMRHQGIVGASFSPDGRRVLTISGRPGTFRIWDAATGRPMSPLMWLDGWDGKSATFSPDGRRVLTVGKGLQTGTAQLWDALIGVPEDAPLLSDLAEAVSGFALSDETGPVRIPDPYWRLERFKQNAAAIGKGSADLQSLAQWLFTDDRLRTLSALSKARD